MASISSLGVGSGLDLTTLVSQLVAAERAPEDNRLNRQQQSAQAQLSAFGSLSSAASRLNDVLHQLGTAGNAMIATSSVPDAIAAQAGATAERGTYTLSVSQLASAQSLATDAFADADQALGTGTLQLAVGGRSVDVAVGTDVLSLRDVRDAINASDLGVQAILVNDSGGARLLLTSGQTGSASAMTLTVDGTLDGRLASVAMTETAPATDAVYRINGLEVTSTSNQIDDLIPGVSLTLQRVTDDPAGVTINVEPDSEQFHTQLGNLVDAYNALVDVITSTGRIDVAGGSSGALVGNAALRSLQARVSGVFSATVATDPPAQFASLLELGLQTDKNGKASLDTTKLDAALAKGDGDVARLVAQFATNLSETLDGYVGSSGLLTSRTSGLSDELRNVAQQRDALDARMSLVEQRLRKQFAALDTLVAQFQQTSSFLTNQLASLANLQPGKQNNN